MSVVNFIAPTAGGFDPYLLAMGWTAGAPDLQRNLLSTDGGLTWSAGTSGLINGLPTKSLNVGSTKLVCTKDRTPSGVYYSADGGVSWARSTTSPGAWAIAYDGTTNVLLTEGNSGNHIWRSTDAGLSWTDLGAKSVATQSTYLFWTGSLFVTKSSAGGAFVATSPDGATWTARAATGSGNCGGSAVSPTKAMLFPKLGGTNALYSTDGGVSWSTVAMPAGMACQENGALYAGGQFVALNPGVGAYYSADGATWSAASMPTGTWLYLYWTGELYVAFSLSGNTVCTSPDAITWTVRSTTDYDSMVLI